ncbi:MAG: formylglycine-generating enzyme family protein [SAR324 cluster bacterium]|nr:formylglycine-generating enzyme family protein [SAR324 cluster bacterium]MBL7035394.1 formylglycine-generating enzyme family protein [SAR324 cluster bacterium]
MPAVNAVTPTVETAETFDSKLELALGSVAALVLKNQKKVTLTVIDLFNYETQERDTQTELLEEKITASLYQKLPKQVVPYYEIVYLRLEWKSTFPEIKHEPLTEDIAKLTEANWLLTGTHQNIKGLLSVQLKLFDLTSAELLWETNIGSKTAVENELAESIPDESELEKQSLEEIVRLRINQDSTARLAQDVLSVIAPVTTPVSEPVLQDSGSEEVGADADKSEFSPLESTIPATEDKPTPEGMVMLPEGEFLMGSYLGNEDELPDHLVFIKGFYLDQHELTNADYSSCSKCERGQGGFDTSDPLQPTVYVDWKNADIFCKTQNKRLPTEEEWEYAARAGSEDEYSFGDNISQLENYAWLKKNTEDLGLWGAKKVATKKPNQWGLYDLYGNVMEWVQNYYRPNYFASVRKQDEPQGLAKAPDEEYPLRVVRGGAWGGMHKAGMPEGMRSAKRYAFVEWTRSFQIGFRCAKDLPADNILKE